MAPLPIAVLASGSGTNLQALLDTVHGREAEVVAVASNVGDAPALERARSRGVATAVFLRGDYEDRPARDAAMAEWLGERGARLVVLAGYMELLSSAFLERFPEAVINVHPSLLPAFPGLHAVEQALVYGVKMFGVTVHFVDAGLDSGPVILQRALELPGAKDSNTVLEHLRPLEHALLPEAVRLFARGALSRDRANPRRVLIAPPGQGLSQQSGDTALAPPDDRALTQSDDTALTQSDDATLSQSGDAADG
jgi:phosphoribosylglycinamide formyltransferase 1